MMGKEGRKVGDGSSEGADGNTAGERKAGCDAFIDARDMHLDLTIPYTPGDREISLWGAWRTHCCPTCYIPINMA